LEQPFFTKENASKYGSMGGRPRGSKDKKWSNLDYWFMLVKHEWPKLDAATRAKIAIDAWKALLARKQISLTPEESVANVDVAMKMLKVLEDAANSAGHPGGDAVCVADRAPEVQTPTASNNGL
jgi:hypothetical protein